MSGITKNESWAYGSEISNSTDFGNFSGTSEYHQWMDHGALKRQLGISIALCSISVVTNTISIGAICHIPGKWNNNFILLINLAICDAMGALAYLVDILSKVYLRWAVGTVDDITYWLTATHLTSLGHIFFVLFYLAAALTLLVFAVHRYIAICTPVRYVYIATSQKIWLSLAGVWLVAGGVALSGTCVYTFINHGTQDYCFIWNYIWPGVLLVICCSIVVLYVAVLNRLNVRARRLRNDSQIEQNYQWFNTTLILIISLIVSILPSMILKLTRMHFPEFINVVYYDFLFYFPYFNFATDPIIYGLRMKDMNDGYKQMFIYKLSFTSRQSTTTNHRMSCTTDRSAISESLKSNNEESTEL